MTMIKGQTNLERVYPVSVFEKDSQYLIKPPTILNFMQDLAADSITIYDERFGFDGLLAKGQGWFLIRYRIEFDDYDKDVKELKVKTESRGCQRMTAYRDFEVLDNKTGARILRAASSWFIVDLSKKSVVNISQTYPDFLKFEKREDDIELRKLKPVLEFDAEKRFHVRYDDLDINRHVNNTVYVGWALEALDYDFRVSHRLKSIDIYFKHEVSYGEDVLSCVKYDRENCVTEHLIKHAQTGDELCLLRAEYVKI